MRGHMPGNSLAKWKLQYHHQRDAIADADGEP